MKYFAGQLSELERTDAEKHIVDCPQCYKTIAQLTKSMFAEETPEEKAFLDAHIKDAENIRLLVKKSIETTENKNSNIVAFPNKTQNPKKKSILPWGISYFAIAASLAFIFLVGSAIFSVVRYINSPKYQIAQSVIELREANKMGRLTNLRLDNFDYAQLAKGRGISKPETQQHLSKANSILEKQINNVPTPETFNLLAEAKLMVENYNEAVAILDKAISLYPKNPALYTTLSATYFASKELEKALVSINKALDINPNYLPGLFNRGLIYKELGENNKARSDWEYYLTLDSTSPWAYEVKEKLALLN